LSVRLTRAHVYRRGFFRRSGISSILIARFEYMPRAAQCGHWTENSSASALSLWIGMSFPHFAHVTMPR